MWATSIGSTFAQRPVSGVRKSGIPEGTETPAPVSATVHSDSPSSSASSAAPTAGIRLLTLPLRAALAEEGGDPLLATLAADGGREAPLLGLDALVEVALGGDGLDLLLGD